MPFVMEPAWRATGGGLTLPPKPNGEADVEPTRIPTSDDTNTTGFGPRLNANAEAIIAALTESLTMQDAEAFTDTESGIGEVIGKALRLTGPVLGSVAESGLSRLVGDEADPEAGVDPSPEADVNNPETSDYTYDAMTQRAIAGEASLEALLATPTESLQQEGWFDILKTAIIKLRPALSAKASVLSRAARIAKAAMDLATAKKNAAAAKKKETAAKKETQVEADQEQNDGGETGGKDEADVSGMNDEVSAEAEFIAELDMESA